ncbi:uncharacterized protein JCM6883_004257 [Sporobolomyces salmoneus]|uniref:uncharacterized protein n=1 Tax=Sporobolomyces salmoneus TaxID=183962 RepID=UPI00317F1D19
MASTPPTSSSGVANVHRYLHLAPTYAQQPRSSSSSSPIASSSSSSLPSKVSLSRGTSNGDSKASKEPRPWQEEELKGLVLEYLLSNCYGDTAEAFANEMKARRDEEDKSERGDDIGGNGTSEENGMQGVEETPPPENYDTARGPKDETKDDEERPSDQRGGGVEGAVNPEQLKDARLRQSIRESILTGRIAQAINLINYHYPSVLLAASNVSTPSSPSKLPRSHPQSPKRFDSCTPKTFFVLSEPSTSPTNAATQSVPIVGSSFSPWATSLSPEILTLNLQLQSFVELMRTGHATSSLSTPSTPTSSVNGLGGGPAAEDAGMTSSIASLASSTTSTSLLSTAITLSQALLSSIQALPPSKEKEGWQRECVDVCGLLAYKDLTNCPVRGYLEMSRREGLAEMVNSAILHATNRTPLSLIELAARSATSVWSTLSEMKVQFPPLPLSTTSNQNGTTKTKVTKTVPNFNFTEFVNNSASTSSAPSQEAMQS